LTIRNLARKDRVFIGFVLVALMWATGDVGTKAVAAAPVSVMLTPTTAPSAGQPGVTVISVTGSNFPSGTISPDLVALTISPANSGPPMSATVTAVTLVVGTSRRISFQIVGPDLPNPTLYQVSVSGSTSGGLAFASGNSAALTINPPAAIGLTPSSAFTGQPLSVAISGQYTNFLNGSTTANFGPGISVGGAALGAFGPVRVISPTSATAQLTIDPAATSEVNTVTVATGVQRASSSFMVNTAVCVGPPSGLLGWWPGEGNANDSTGHDVRSWSSWSSVQLSGFVHLAHKYPYNSCLRSSRRRDSCCLDKAE
jgi:hypothetical protein